MGGFDEGKETWGEGNVEVTCGGRCRRLSCSGLDWRMFSC